MAGGYYALLAQQRPLDFADHFSRAYLQGQAQRAARERDQQMIAGQRDYERERASLIPEAEQAYTQRGDAQMLREVAPEHLAKLEQAEANKARFEEAQQAQMQAAQQRQRVAELRRAAAGGSTEAERELAIMAPDDPFLGRIMSQRKDRQQQRMATMDPLAKQVANETGLPFGSAEFRQAYAVARQREDSQRMARASAVGGRTLAPTSVEGLADAGTAIAAVDTLLDSFVESVPTDGIGSQIGARVSGLVPNTAVSQYQNNANVAAQVIGTFLEGGKLAEADLPRYKAMLPQPGDSVGTARKKRDAIKRLIQERAQGRASGLRGAGYNVPQDPGGDIDLNGAAELTDEELDREIAAAGGGL